MASPKNDLFDIFDFSNLINLVRKNWYWFLVSIALCLMVAVIYLKVSPKVYEVTTSVFINEGTNSLQSASEQVLRDNISFISSNQKMDLDNEILILRSSSSLEKAIQGLDLQVSYYKYNHFVKKELYKSAPFLVILKPDYPQPIGCEFVINILNDKEYEITLENKNKVAIYNLDKKQLIKELPNLNVRYRGKFGQVLRSDNMGFKILLNSNFNLNDIVGQHYTFKIHTQKELVLGLQWDIQFIPFSSNTLAFSMRTTTPQKAIDILSNLTSYYIQNEWEKKVNMSDKTIEYIDNQLLSIQGSLRSAENKLNRFRSSNELIDITRQSGQIFTEISNLEAQKAAIEMNLKYYNYINEYFQERNEIELIAPSAMGIEDDVLNSLVEELISLKAEKFSLIENKQDKSPYLREISIRIENLQKMIVENISYYKKTNKNVLADIEARIKQLSSEAGKLPKTQRELLGYERQYQINDELYSYLLEKKSEAEIAKASVQSEIEVLEPADTTGIPVAPKKKVTLFIAFVMGSVIPLAILQFIQLIKNTYSTEDEIKNSMNIPFLSQIHRNNRKSENVVVDYPRSNIAESFRKLAARLPYFLLKDSSKIIGISSTISQEGKSFVALNLASTLANQGYKTILLGFDLRKPKKYESLKVELEQGLSEYLSKQVSLSDVIKSTQHKNLDLIWAGEIPPNPFNLINSPSTTELFEQLQNDYDYIIIDTAPIGILSDSNALLKISDLKIIVTRLNRTPKKEVQTLLTELQEQRMENVAYIVNDIPLTKKAHYGYGYYSHKKHQ